MYISSTLTDQLIKDEGLRLMPYKCTAGKLTIGVGRNIEDIGISKNEAMILLTNDIIKCTKEAKDILGNVFDRLNIVRREVVINMVFNLGKTRFLRFKNTIKAIKDEDFFLAHSEMKNSKWYNQVGSRAERLANEMLTGNKS